ncbi:MAG: hypothetical protein ACXVGB_00355 [Mycobacteriaceae bacterium]
MATFLPGSVREVFFSKLAAPSTKWSFLVRDDAGSKSGQSFGRTIRLGDPIDTGNESGWQQLSWEGGNGQRLWSDQQMYLEGCADIFTTPGRFRMWPGSEHIMSNNRKIEGFILSHGADHDGNSTPLWCGETAMHLGTLGSVDTLAANPGGGWALNRWDPVSESFKTVQLFTGPIMSICPLMSDDGSDKYIHLTCQNGKYYMLKDDGTQVNSAFEDTNAVAMGFQSHSLVAFGGAMYYCQGNWLGKRVAVTPYGVTGTHTKVKEHRGARYTRGLAVWQNRLWYGVQFGAGYAALWTSDGVTSNQAVAWQEEFIPQNIIAHYGSLYIAGFKPSNTSNKGTRAQVWKYSGSSLTKLWEQGDGRDGKVHMASGLTTMGSLVVWTHDGYSSREDEDQPWPNRRPGLMMYDVEKDSLFEGPAVCDMDAASNGVKLSDVLAYNNTLVWAAYDHTNYSNTPAWEAIVGQVREPNSVRHNISPSWFHSRGFAATLSTRQDRITSSEYAGPPDVAYLSKVWLRCRVRARIKAANAQIRVVAYLDGKAGEVTVGTISYDSTNVGWRNVDFTLKDGTDYVTSTSIQLRFYLENTAGGTSSTANAEVDAMAVKYNLIPTKQRSWRLRAVCQDGQLTLAGAANSLTTAQAMADKLEDLWSSRIPFNLYEPQAASGGPSGSAIEVQASDFNIQSYRLDDASTEVVQEVTLTLNEVV